MPFIHIKSLPFDPPIEATAVVEALTEDFAEGTGVGLEHVTATWDYFPPGHYAVAGKSFLSQPQSTHPVLVDLLSPDYDDSETIESMLRVVAASISKHANIPIRNIFINYRQAHSGMVFDSGEVEQW